MLFLQFGEHYFRRLAMRRLDVVGHQLDRGGEYGRIVAVANDRQKVGNSVGWQHEIGNGADQHRFDMMRRIAVEGAVISREQVLRERDLRDDAAKLAPEVAAQAVLVIVTIE